MKHRFEYPHAWTAIVDGVGRVPAMWEEEMQANDMVVVWTPTTKRSATRVN